MRSSRHQRRHSIAVRCDGHDERRPRFGAGAAEDEVVGVDGQPDAVLAAGGGLRRIEGFCLSCQLGVSVFRNTSVRRSRGR